MASATDLAKVAPRVLLHGPQLSSDSDVSGWESMLFHYRSLQRSFEDLGALLYPPQVCGCRRRAPSLHRHDAIWDANCCANGYEKEIGGMQMMRCFLTPGCPCTDIISPLVAPDTFHFINYNAPCSDGLRHPPSAISLP